MNSATDLPLIPKPTEKINEKQGDFEIKKSTFKKLNQSKINEKISFTESQENEVNKVRPYSTQKIRIKVKDFIGRTDLYY